MTYEDRPTIDELKILVSIMNDFLISSSSYDYRVQTAKEFKNVCETAIDTAKKWVEL